MNNNGDLELGEVDVIEKTFQSLVDCVNNEVHREKPWIYMAPSMLRDLSPTSFNPRLVSIGPLHREDDNVQAFEKIKIRCLINLIERTESPFEEILQSCVHKVYSSMDKIKGYYIWTKRYDDDEVAKMMVMDACFILRYILRYWYEEASELFKGYSMLIQSVRFDLVLTENQIPLFILDEIFQCTIAKFMQNTSLVEFIFPLLQSLSIFKETIKIDNISISTTPHILGLLHECYKPQDNTSSEWLTSIKIDPVADLDRAGIKFKPNQNPRWVLGMEVRLSGFQRYIGCWGKPTLTMPVLLVSDDTEMVFRNLIVYEQTCQTDNHITSYAGTMDMLVNTQEDVVKLVESGVLINIMSSNEEVANMINSICKEAVFQDNFYAEPLEKLNKYYNSYWPKHIAWMKRTYFGSPWSIIALLAGTVLFVLTIIQTIFTVKPAGSTE